LKEDTIDHSKKQAKKEEMLHRAMSNGQHLSENQLFNSSVFFSQELSLHPQGESAAPI